MSKTEANFLVEKKNFDLVRFSYFSYLFNLHGGKKGREILQHVMNHYEKQLAYHQKAVQIMEPIKQDLDKVVSSIAQASRERNIVNQERDAKLQLLVSKQVQRKSATAVPSPPTSSPTSESSTSSSSAAPVSPIISEINLEASRVLDTSENNKREITANWHKYWYVASGEQIFEYSNWKKQLESRIEPINLRFATVREARNAGRRFCFEVITPN